MPRAADIPRRAERLVVNELWLVFEDRLGSLGAFRPRHWQIIRLVWSGMLRGRTTTALVLARSLRLSHQTVGRYLQELETAGVLQRERRDRWTIGDAWMRKTVQAKGKRALIIDEMIDAIHAASDQLRKLRK